jgi:hypothetical protein
MPEDYIPQEAEVGQEPPEQHRRAPLAVPEAQDLRGLTE